MARFAPAGNTLQPVVLDLGGITTRAGFAGDDVPALTFPSVVGQYEQVDGTSRQACELEVMGAERWPNLKVQRLSFPRTPEMREEICEALYKHAFCKLGADPTEQPLLLSEPITMSMHCRQRTAELTFEGLGVPVLCIAKTSELSAISFGRTSALVLDVGGYESSAVAVIEGQTATCTVKSSRIAAASLALLLEKQLGAALASTCTAQQKGNQPSDSLSKLRREVRCAALLLTRNAF